jgi:hypothetical protein
VCISFITACFTEVLFAGFTSQPCCKLLLLLLM